MVQSPPPPLRQEKMSSPWRIFTKPKFLCINYLAPLLGNVAPCRELSSPVEKILVTPLDGFPTGDEVPFTRI